ncbi:MAG: DUF1015 domain-containing protein [Candidatus Thermoplasmatota archaeon]|nr:DUF1015 domain-containing protein [Candidatus Thermoplasmatota archaeon]
MVEVKPFRGITYNTKKFNNFDNLMSPPYDIISKMMQDQLYNNNDYNFVRLILGKKKQDDNEISNYYTRAKEFLEKWLSENILVGSEENSIYPYKINYEINNQKKIMNGFFILLKIDKNYEKIRAHEKTLSKPKEDRLNLMRNCKANLEPIQLLYVDEKDEINKIINDKINNPIFQIKAYDSFYHTLWKLEDKKIIKHIEKILKNKILFIADGHHRYQTAINFANEMSGKYQNYNDDSPFNYRMVILVNMFDEGLSILPTHRLVKKDEIDINKFLSKLENYFEIIEKNITNDNIINIEKKIMSDISSENKKQFVLYLKNKYYILTLKNLNLMDKVGDTHSKIWKSLDVSILQKLIFEEILNINQENLENHVFYTRDLKEAIQFVNEEKYNFSFLMNPTKINELKAIAESGEHMPQKSTYFLPKMLSGLVMYKMDI